VAEKRATAARKGESLRRGARLGPGLEETFGYIDIIRQYRDHYRLPVMHTKRTPIKDRSTPKLLTGFGRHGQCPSRRQGQCSDRRLHLVITDRSS
jgi:hypothetical protein